MFTSLVTKTKRVNQQFVLGYKNSNTISTISTTKARSLFFLLATTRSNSSFRRRQTTISTISYYNSSLSIGKRTMTTSATTTTIKMGKEEEEDNNHNHNNNFAFDPPPIPFVPILHNDDDNNNHDFSAATSKKYFPVHRIYCVGRNYADHVKEMGGDPKLNPPTFFCKPNDAIVVCNNDNNNSTGSDSDLCTTRSTTMISLEKTNSDNLHYEVELVVALGPKTKQASSGGGGGNDNNNNNKNTLLPHADIFGYAVGIDLTRRDLQAVAKKSGSPWDTAKAFDRSAPIGPITPVSKLSTTTNGVTATSANSTSTIELTVNGDVKQSSTLGHMIWNIPEILQHLSNYFELRPGDLIFTGTPSGVGALHVGDIVRGTVEGLEPVELRIAK